MRKVRLPMKNIKVTENRIRVSQKTDDEYNRLKNSIRQLGLSVHIIVTDNLELVSGFYRLKAFIELNNEDPTNEAFLDIPTLIVSTKEEAEDLKIDFMDGRATDYMRDTAVDRLFMVYKPIEFRDIPLHEFLKISNVELIHRLEVGEAIRNREIPEEIVKKYKDGTLTHSFLYNWMEERVKEVELPYKEGVIKGKPPISDLTIGEPIIPEKEMKNFDVNDWI